MPEALHPIVRFAYYANLLSLMLASREAFWHHATVLLPWALTLCSKACRAHALHIARHYGLLTVASATLACLMIVGCQIRTASPQEFEAAFIPLLWIPIAALTHTSRSSHPRDILTLISCAALIVSTTVIWQFFAQGESRPRGLSYNVLTAPMIMAMLCLLAAINSAGENHKYKAPTLTIVALATIGIIATICTQSKTGLLAFITATITYTLTNIGKIRKILTIAIPIAIVWAFTLTNELQLAHSDIVKYEGKQYRTSTGERTDAILWSTSHLKDSPWLGKGTTTLHIEFNQRWQEWGRKEADISKMLHLHNDYLQIALSYGWPACFAFIIVWTGLASSIVKSTRSQALCRPPPASAPWALTLVSIFMTAFLTDSFTYWNYTWAMSICCLGIAIATMSPLPNSQYHSR